MIPTELLLSLPNWIAERLGETPIRHAEIADRMSLVIDLAGENVRRRTGGPFAAGVFEMGSGELVSAAVNVVLPAHCSIAHAEMLAIGLAQQRLATASLKSQGERSYELVSSAEPCAMCLGGLPWSGVGRLVCAARQEDVEAVGFDEGDKPHRWDQLLSRRGVEVVRDVMREDATAVLREYEQSGGAIYGG